MMFITVNQTCAAAWYARKREENKTYGNSVGCSWLIDRYSTNRPWILGMQKSLRTFLGINVFGGREGRLKCHRRGWRREYQTKTTDHDDQQGFQGNVLKKCMQYCGTNYNNFNEVTKRCFFIARRKRVPQRFDWSIHAKEIKGVCLKTEGPSACLTKWLMDRRIRSERQVTCQFHRRLVPSSHHLWAAS